MTTPASTPATAPAADARDLALAHYAARGVLETVLARHGITFQQQVTLRAAITADTPQTPDGLLARVQESLKADPAGIRTTIDHLRSGRLLVADGPHLRPTDAGRELLAAVSAETAPSPPVSGTESPPRTWPPPAVSSPWSPSAPTRNSRP